MQTQKKSTIMMDIETLGLGPTTVQTQIAFIAVDSEDPETILREAEEYLPIQPQFTIGRTFDADTLIWWLTNPDVSQAARDKFTLNKGEDFDELSALVQSIARKLKEVIDSSDEYEIVFRGPQFDEVNVRTLMQALGIQVPWRYDLVRDLRSIMAEAGITKSAVPMRPGLVPHHARSDCRYQLDCLFAARAGIKRVGTIIPAQVD